MKISVYLALPLVAGCAAHSGIAPIGPDTYMVSRQAATWFSGSGTLKAEALREANQHCVGQNKVLQVVNTIEAQPPFILGNFPKAEVQFMCLDANPNVRTMPRKQVDPVLEILR